MQSFPATHDTLFPFRFFYRHSVEEAKISKGRSRVCFGVFLRLLRMLGRDVRHSFVFYYGEEKTKKQVRKKKSRSGRVLGEEHRRRRERAAGARRVCGTGAQLKTAESRVQERDKKKASKKNFQKKLYASKQSITPPHIDLFPHL